VTFAKNIAKTKRVSFYPDSIQFHCSLLLHVVSENEILREGNLSLDILRDKLKTRVSDLEEELRRLREELEQAVSNRETKTADDEVKKNTLALNNFCLFVL